MIKIYSLSVKNLSGFIDRLKTLGFTIEEGPHVVLEDNSEVSVFKGYRNNELEFIIVSHYLTQYYKAILENPGSGEEYLEKLLALKYSSERWSIPVSPIYFIAFNTSVEEFLSSFKDDYPVENAEEILSKYKSANPNYQRIVEAVVGRIIDGLSEG